MTVLYLPGASELVKDHGIKFAAAMGMHSNDVVSIAYPFWNGAKPELGSILAEIPHNNFDVCIARSLGALICLEALRMGLLTTRHIVLFGIPFNMCLAIGVNEAQLKHTAEAYDVLIIHNTRDPIAQLGELTQSLSNKVLFIEVEDHDYDDFERYRSMITQYLKRDILA